MTNNFFKISLWSNSHQATKKSKYCVNKVLHGKRASLKVAFVDARCEWALTVWEWHAQNTDGYSWSHFIVFAFHHHYQHRQPTPHYILCLQMTSLLIPCYRGNGNNVIICLNAGGFAVWVSSAEKSQISMSTFAVLTRILENEIEMSSAKTFSPNFVCTPPKSITKTALDEPATRETHFKTKLTILPAKVTVNIDTMLKI